MRSTTRSARWLALVTVAALGLAACGDDGGDGDGDAGGEAVDLSDPESVEGDITVLHAFTGESDVAGLQAVIDGFTEEYPNVNVQEEGSNDFESLARTRIGAGTPPDVILHPQPGLLENFVEQGVVTPVDDFVDRSSLQENLVGGLLDYTVFEDTNYGVPLRLSLKSLVWYDPELWEENGWEIPETWDEMMDLTMQIADAGEIAPWCIGIESGDATGWVATDWVEDILLRTIGPEAYDEWVAGDLEFSSDEVQGAIEEYMVPIWTNDEFVFGGQRNIINTAFGDSINGILNNDCAMHRQATFIEGFIDEDFPDAEFGTEYDFFYLPPIGDERPVLTAGDLAAPYTDSAAVQAFMNYLATPAAGEPWAAQGGYLSPFAPVFDGSIYPSDSARTSSDILANSDFARFDGSDVMPGPVGSSSQDGSFWIEMSNWVAGDQDLETALNEIDELYASIEE